VSAEQEVLVVEDSFCEAAEEARCSML
jgi:hypothetical protein